jgi:hypothetical protein
MAARWTSSRLEHSITGAVSRVVVHAAQKARFSGLFAFPLMAMYQQALLRRRTIIAAFQSLSHSSQFLAIHSTGSAAFRISALNTYANPPHAFYRAKLCEPYPHPRRSKFFAQQTSDKFAQSFDQIEMPTREFRPDIFNDYRIINGIGDIVAEGGGFRHAKAQVEFDGLRCDALAGMNSHPGIDAQPFDKDEIHRGSQ